MPRAKKRATSGKRRKAGKVSVVVPGELLVGNQFVSADAAALRELGVTAVVAIGCRMQHPESEFAYYHVGMRDRADADISGQLSAATAWARARVSRGGCVLMHCKAGMSRSPAFAIAYLVRYHGHDVASATARVVEARPIAKPRPEFLEQIAQWAAADFAAPSAPKPQHARREHRSTGARTAASEGASVSAGGGESAPGIAPAAAPPTAGGGGRAMNAPASRTGRHHPGRAVASNVEGLGL